jgi:hypothetical protein
MLDLRAAPRTHRFEFGTPVRHRLHGVGSVVGEWGPIAIDLGRPTPAFSDCSGIYDCIFGEQPHRFMHCCRAEYLQRVQ